jgi:prevent-host-death family protein
MKSKVGIAELKAHLSEYIRAAQKGKEVIIKDRETPVAKLMPLEPAHKFLRVIPATRSMAEVERLLDENPDVPVLPPDPIEKIFADTRKDVFDKWIAGELT